MSKVIPGEGECREWFPDPEWDDSVVLSVWLIDFDRESLRARDAKGT